MSLNQMKPNLFCSRKYCITSFVALASRTEVCDELPVNLYNFAPGEPQPLSVYRRRDDDITVAELGGFVKDSHYCGHAIH